MVATTARKKKPAKKDLLAEIGITPEQAEEFQLLASVPDDVMEAIKEEVMAANDGDLLTSEIRKRAIAYVRRANLSASPDVSRSSPINCRRSRKQVQELRDRLYLIIQQYKPMTVRQVYYQAVTRKLIDKTEAEYKQTICRLLADMRRDGELPYDWIADNTRWQRKPDTYHGLSGMLASIKQTYRRAVWDDQDVYLEVWLEKEALAGVLYDVTWDWDVPLMVTRGYPSLSFIHSAAEAISTKDKPVHLYYFGDLDPSGVDITRAVEEGIREMAPDADLTFERVAVTREQVQEYSLPTRPTKKTDSRSKGFDGESVEVDAIEPDELRAICKHCIEQHVDQERYDRMLVVEEAERETLRRISERLSGEESR